MESVVKYIAFDEFGVKNFMERHISKAPETIREVYGLVILILLFWIIKKQKIRPIDYIGIFFFTGSIFFRQRDSHCSCIFYIDNLYLSIIFKG